MLLFSRTLDSALIVYDDSSFDAVKIIINTLPMLYGMGKKRNSPRVCKRVSRSVIWIFALSPSLRR